MRGFETAVLILLSTQLCLGWSLGQSGSTSRDQTFKQAIDAHQAGEFDKAIQEYQKFLTLYPKVGDIHYNLGAAYAAIGDYERAIVSYEEAVGLDNVSDPSALRFNLAWAYFKDSQILSAERVLSELLVAQPDHGEGRLLLAQCYLLLNRNQEAIELLTPFADRAEDDLELAYLLGTALIKDSQFERGLELAQLISRHGESAQVQLLLGTAHMMTLDYVRAEEDLKRALELNPRLPKLNATYGELLGRMTRNEEANEAFRKELEINPFDFESNVVHGLYLSEAKQEYEEALACFERALRSRPGDLRVRFQIAVVYSLTNRIDEAVELIETVVEEAPDFMEGHATLVRLYYRLGREEDAERSRIVAEQLRTQTDGQQLMQQGRVSEAAERFNQLKQANPLDPEPYFLAGMAFSQMPDWNAAIAELKEALRLDPERLEFRVTYANALTHLGQHGPAVETLGPLQQEWLERLAPPLVWLLAEIYYGAGKTGEAMQVVEALSRKDPDNAQVHFFRGQIYFVDGDLDQAAEALEASLRKQPENNPHAYFILGEVRRSQGQIELAKQAYFKAASQDPKNERYIVSVGSSLLALGKPREAIEYLERPDPSPEIANLLELARGMEKDQNRPVPQNSEVTELLNQAEQSLQAGRLMNAERLFKKVLETDPTNWSAHTYLVDMYLREGLLRQAYNYLIALERLDSESPTVHYLMADYWYQGRDYRRARDYALKVETLHVSNPEFRNLLGSIYFALGEIQKAVEEYKAATELAPVRSEFRLNLQAARKRLTTDN